MKNQLNFDDLCTPMTPILPIVGLSLKCLLTCTKHTIDHSVVIILNTDWLLQRNSWRHK